MSFLKFTLFAALVLLCNFCLATDHYQWKNITVGAGGFAPNIIFSTAEKNLAYLRTDMGGIYRWESKQQRWLPLQDHMLESSYFGIESIAPDPKDPNVIHAAVGMYKHYPAAMMRSFDRGENWEVFPVPYKMGGNEDARGMGERLAIDPNNTDILYFGTRHDGLIRSIDRGASWQKVESFPYKGLGLPKDKRKTNAGISFIIFDKSSKAKSKSQTLFVAVADPAEQHLYRSDNGGKSWQSVANEPNPKLRPSQGAISGDDFYITYSNNTGPNGVTGGAVFKLNIRTKQWRDITPGHNDTPNKKNSAPPGGFMGLSLSHQNPNTLVVATMNRWRPGDTLFRSTNGGKSWVELGKRSQRDVSATPYLYWGNPSPNFGWWISGLAINPFDDEELVYTTGATVYKTQTASAKGKLQWRPWIKGIEQTAVITLRSLPEGPAELLSGFGDISGFVHTDFDQSPQTMFTAPVFANTNTIDYAQQSPNIIVRSGTHPHRGKKGDPTLAYSEDYGMSWRPLSTPPIKLKPQDTPTRYDLSGDNAITISADGATLMFMAPIPLISRDKGKSWHKVAGLPQNLRPIPDRVNPQKFYALDFQTSTLYLSQNGGEKFEQIKTLGLPRNIANERPTWREDAWPLLASPFTEGHLWYVSHQGLYRSIDGGKTFSKINSSVHVEEMDFGKAPEGSTEPSLLAIGIKSGKRAIWRSDDSGKTWLEITTARHQYGQRFRCIAGDLRHFGRVYVGTDGRGIVMGQPQ